MGNELSSSIVKAIKADLRASMNGVLSARMREAGMPYKLIFGVELPRLQSIAQEFTQDKDLANQLWQENIRETRLLAIILMPPEAFSTEMSRKWAETMVTAEEAQVMAMMLLPKTKQAKEISLAWLKEGKPLPATCACLSLRHLLIQGVNINEKEQILDDCKRLLPDANLHLRKAIQALTTALKE